MTAFWYSFWILTMANALLAILFVLIQLGVTANPAKARFLRLIRRVQRFFGRVSNGADGAEDYEGTLVVLRVCIGVSAFAMGLAALLVVFMQE